jgi:hypothetical protein
VNLAEIVSGIFQPAKDLISEIVPDKDARDKLFAAWDTAVLQFQSVLVQERSKVIQAEANSESWITRNWRPLTMLTFVTLVVMRWTGLTVSVPESVEVELMGMIKLGLTGYVLGRSVEKVAPGLLEKLVK